MTLKLKLTLSFLLVSFLTAGAVGATAWWMFTEEFHGAARERAFENFREDVLAYVVQYGSWEAGERIQPFPEFVMRRRLPSNMPPPPDALPPGSLIRRGRPPFQFLLLTPGGRAVRSVGDFEQGQPVPEHVRRRTKPIVVNGETVLYAAPVGEPLLSPEDRIYFQFMQRALLFGMAAAAVVAILLGIAFGSRLVASLQELVRALGRMRPDGEMPEPVPIRSRDEIGLLAETFNRMSRQLMEAHRQLLNSHGTISAQADELRELSLRDPLTSLNNRRGFDEQAQTLFRQAVRHRHALCVMVADLDHFKAINDNFTHAVGDEVLRRVAAIFQKNTRGSDLLARYGGEEFVAAFAESTLDQAYRRSEELRRYIEREPWDRIAPGLKVTVSIGLCDDTGLVSLEAMLRAADAQLYRAKEGGRNRVEPGERQEPPAPDTDGSGSASPAC